MMFDLLDHYVWSKKQRGGFNTPEKSELERQLAHAQTFDQK